MVMILAIRRFRYDDGRVFSRPCWPGRIRLQTIRIGREQSPRRLLRALGRKSGKAPSMPCPDPDDPEEGAESMGSDFRFEGQKGQRSPSRGSPARCGASDLRVG